MLHVCLFHDTASDKLICSIRVKILTKCFILIVLCTFIAVYKSSFPNLVTAVPKLTMCTVISTHDAKPIVLTAHFQVTNVDISMQCVVGFFLCTFRNSLLKNLGTERKSKRKLFTCAQFPRCQLWSMAEGDVNNVVKPCSK